MDEVDQMRVNQASASMDSGQKALLYEVMKKNVGLNTLISIFIPGGGQIYLSQYLKGILILLFSWLIIPWLYGIYDAHTTANRFNLELYGLIYPESSALALNSVKIQVQE
jgi:TM2 domain-containing membrane protein YozV